MLNRGVNMAKVLETKKKICRYVDLDKCVGEVKCFGWELTNKILLNRFGNPLNPNEDISESDLREKCSYELSLMREVEKESISQLNSLEFEYESIKYLPSHFSGGRVTGCVFLTIAIIVLSIITSSFYEDHSIMVTLLVLTTLAFLGLLATILTGVFSVRSNCEKNDKIDIRKKEILQSAKKLI